MKIRSNFMLRLASFLFIAVIASTVMLSGLLARYTTSGYGTDQARVIKFGNIEIKETASFNADKKLVICPGVPITKDVEVFFSGSEAQTYVFLKMDASSNWETTDYITYKIDDFLSFSIDTKEWTYLSGTDYVYYKKVEPNHLVGRIEGYSHIGVDVIADGSITVSEMLTESDLKAMKPVDLDFSAVVVQANGFDKVEDAWASVKDK